MVHFIINREDSEWGSQQKPIANFSTVEDFWAVYNNILPVKKLEANCNYHYFKVFYHFTNHYYCRREFVLRGKMKIM